MPRECILYNIIYAPTTFILQRINPTVTQSSGSTDVCYRRYLGVQFGPRYTEYKNNNNNNNNIHRQYVVYLFIFICYYFSYVKNRWGLIKYNIIIFYIYMGWSIWCKTFNSMKKTPSYFFKKNSFYYIIFVITNLIFSKNMIFFIILDDIIHFYFIFRSRILLFGVFLYL